MKAYELLNSPSKWTKGAWARNQEGESIDAESSEAVCWCLGGAINKCYCIGPLLNDIVTKFYGNADIGGEESMVHWNDKPERTYQEVYNIRSITRHR